MGPVNFRPVFVCKQKESSVPLLRERKEKNRSPTDSVDLACEQLIFRTTFLRLCLLPITCIMRGNMAARVEFPCSTTAGEIRHYTVPWKAIDCP